MYGALLRFSAANREAICCSGDNVPASVLKIHIDGVGANLTEAANKYQRDMRHTGRPISHRKLINTTLLVKGLEYDHAVILDVDALDAKDLYVAMTRSFMAGLFYYS